MVHQTQLSNVSEKHILKTQLKQLRTSLKIFSTSVAYKHWNTQELDWYKTELEIQVNVIKLKLKV